MSCDKDISKRAIDSSTETWSSGGASSRTIPRQGQGDEGSQWCTDLPEHNTGEGNVKAAIAVFDHDLKVIQYPQLTTNNIVVVGIQTEAWEITLTSFYFEPEPVSIDSYLLHLKKIESTIGSRRWIAGGDANAKSKRWGSPMCDNRGEEVLGVFTELGLNILNRGETPTFDTIRGGKQYQSHIDVTTCSTDMLDLVENWRIDEGLTSSDHNGMIFNIRLQKSKGIQISRTTRKFNTKKANWPEFHEKLGEFLEVLNVKKNSNRKC